MRWRNTDRGQTLSYRISSMGWKYQDHGSACSCNEFPGDENVLFSITDGGPVSIVFGVVSGLYPTRVPLQMIFGDPHISCRYVISFPW